MSQISIMGSIFQASPNYEEVPRPENHPHWPSSFELEQESGNGRKASYKHAFRASVLIILLLITLWLVSITMSFARDTECKKDNCLELYIQGYREGVYELHVDGLLRPPKEVYCTADGWTVIQSRGQFGNPQNYFNRSWDDYVTGFGTAGEEHWLGLESIYYLTNAHSMKLRIRMTGSTGPEKAIAYYDHFQLTNKEDFTLSVSNYSGNANDSLTFHNGQKFSTFDMDNESIVDNKNTKKSSFPPDWAGIHSPAS